MTGLTRLTKNTGNPGAQRAPEGSKVKYRGCLINKDAGESEIKIILDHARILGVRGGKHGEKKRI